MELAATWPFGTPPKGKKGSTREQENQENQEVIPLEIISSQRQVLALREEEHELHWTLAVADSVLKDASWGS